MHQHDTFNDCKDESFPTHVFSTQKHLIWGQNWLVPHKLWDPSFYLVHNLPWRTGNLDWLVGQKQNIKQAKRAVVAFPPHGDCSSSNVAEDAAHTYQSPFVCLVMHTQWNLRFFLPTRATAINQKFNLGVMQSKFQFQLTFFAKMEMDHVYQDIHSQAIKIETYRVYVFSMRKRKPLYLLFGWTIS